MSLYEYPSQPLLLVDDEERALQSLEFLLISNGIENVRTCNDSREVLSTVKNEEFAAITLDLTMPHVSGEELLKELSEGFPEIPVIIVTGANDIRTAVKCMAIGAFNYILKPVEESHFVGVIKRAIELRELRQENDMLKTRLMSGRLEKPEAFANIITNNSRMLSIFQYVETIAKTPKPLLITGDTGTGKELFARAVHHASEMSGSFVSVNVAGLDDNVFSDTLFGHKKGAFTGADDERSGLIEKANGGTLFLDEIGDLSSQSQVKLLRLLQEREYYQLGSDVPKESEARIITATNKNLEQLQYEGSFRKDLYFRIIMHHVNLPPLSERKDDLPLLIDHFLEKSSAELNKKKPTPPVELFTLLSTYDFPGNVRELEAMVYDAVSQHSSKMLSMNVFKNYLSSGKSMSEIINENKDETVSPFNYFEKLPTLEEATQLLIQEALKRSEGKQAIAAQLLGISQPALSRRLKYTREK